MARKEPLLSALKGGVLRLREGGGPCTDTSPHLASLCQLLESILRKGLRRVQYLRDSPVPSTGMVLRYVDGRVFVTKVLPESQAEVDEVVLAGDILDEINGCSLRHAFPGQAGAVLQRLKGQPLTVRLLRWRWHDGTLFEPLLPYLKALKEKEPHFQLQRSPRHRGEGEPRQLQGGRLLYNLRYLGQTSVGTYGGKEVLEGAIPAVLERGLAAREVLFDVKEAEVLVQEKASSKLLCRHPYPSISCVGRCTWSPRIFAFCVV
ncbi:hypothetical protein DUI87_31359 [Hirundo rustica rustica]|uniref:PDZ domain-containing protein n=1 Tax=Hirundo rustica rustica TaxID=333673 RepID=A0A3M0IUX3_HIRRU|nr:hypothetical protein DUI87_31359 [Hirundo rustica rustica]